MLTHALVPKSTPYEAPTMLPITDQEVENEMDTADDSAAEPPTRANPGLSSNDAFLAAAER